MNKNSALIIAMLLGVVAVALMFGYIKKSIDSKTAGWEMKTVLVAAEDLAEGTELTAQNTAQRPYPVKYVADRAIDPGQVAMVLGGELLVNAEKGKPIFWTDLRPTAAIRGGLSTDLQPDMRAVTIPVTQLSSFDGMLRPGMNVDILWTGEESFFTKRAIEEGASEGGGAEGATIQEQMAKLQRGARKGGAKGDERKTLLLLQDVPVIAIGDQRSSARLQMEKPDAFSTATVMVDEVSARVLVHACGAGAISLILRQAGDARRQEGPVVMGVEELADFLARPLR